MDGEKKIDDFEILVETIDIEKIKQLVRLRNAELLMAIYIFELLKGFNKIPTKKQRTALARVMIKKGFTHRKVIKLTGISRSSYYRLKQGIENANDR